eukprot:4238290-Amphidinium_carterae.1
MRLPKFPFRPGRMIRKVWTQLRTLHGTACRRSQGKATPASACTQCDAVCPKMLSPRFHQVARVDL